MHWYVVHVVLGREKKLVDFFNEQENTVAFIPKYEKWYNIKGHKSYVLKDLYPDYVFIKSHFNKDEFNEIYKEFFRSIGGFAYLLEFDEVTALTDSEKEFMEKMFQGTHIIRHSDGNIINKVLKIDSGPLVGLEDKVIKIDRHHREATLLLGNLNQKMKVSLNVITKS